MSSSAVQNLLTVTAAVAGLLTLQATTNEATGQESRTPTAAGERTAQTATFVTCDGGAQEAVFTNTQNAVTSTSGTRWAVLTSSIVPGGPSGGGADLYTLTLSGEFSSNSFGDIEAIAQVSVDGSRYVNMHPIGPNTMQMTTNRETHTMTWCRVLGASSSTTFRIVWRKLGGGTAYLDDYLVRVERSD